MIHKNKILIYFKHYIKVKECVMFCSNGQQYANNFVIEQKHETFE